MLCFLQVWGHNEWKYSSATLVPHYQYYRFISYFSLAIFYYRSFNMIIFICWEAVSCRWSHCIWEVAIKLDVLAYSVLNESLHKAVHDYICVKHEWPFTLEIYQHQIQHHSSLYKSLDGATIQWMWNCSIINIARWIIKAQLSMQTICHNNSLFLYVITANALHTTCTIHVFLYLDVCVCFYR